MKPVAIFPVDPAVQALTPVKREQDVREFLRLLDEGVPELDVHRFLASHTYFFDGLVRLFGPSPIYSKIRLGSSFEVDFAGFDASSSGPEWNLIEIEAPRARLFTKSGNPSAALTHAIRQVEDWQAWVHDNVPAAQRLMPHVTYPQGWVFIGRRTELTPDSQRRLRRMNYEMRRSVQIHTLDRFVSVARGIPIDGAANWCLPMKALTHADLAKGLPERANAFMAGFFSNTPGRPPFPDEMLEDRDQRYAPQEVDGPEYE